MSRDRIPFAWTDAQGNTTIYPSYNHAAKALGVTMQCIMYRARKNYHSASDMKLPRNGQSKDRMHSLRRAWARLHEKGIA